MKPRLASGPKTATCIYCGKQFEHSPFGKTPRFCSPKCRTYWHRDNKRNNPELPLQGGAK